MITRKMNGSSFKCYVTEDLTIIGIYDENPHLIISDLKQIFYGNEEGVRLKLYVDDTNNKVHLTFITKEIDDKRDIAVLNNLSLDEASIEVLSKVDISKRTNFYLFKDIDDYKSSIEIKPLLPYIPIVGIEIY